LIYRKDLIEASEKIKEVEDKGLSHRVVDLFNEDRLLQERASATTIPEIDYFDLYY
jgi:hypothetical protein